MRAVKNSLLCACLLLGLSLSAAAEEDRTLHLALGDPARKDREAPLALDTLTDTRTGDLLTRADLPARLGGVRLVLVGESHTDADFHQAQLRVLQELQRAGREVLIGLEMYPETEQRWLDAWSDGSLTEDGFLRLSRWYKNWGYNWGYYRDIFLFARDHGLRMIALNAPREIVSAEERAGGPHAGREVAHRPPDRHHQRRAPYPDQRLLRRRRSAPLRHAAGAARPHVRRAVYLGRHHGPQRRQGPA
jgi:uncharacterized iron-regulated protein